MLLRAAGSKTLWTWKMTSMSASGPGVSMCNKSARSWCSAAHSPLIGCHYLQNHSISRCQIFWEFKQLQLSSSLLSRVNFQTGSYCLSFRHLCISFLPTCMINGDIPDFNLLRRILEFWTRACRNRSLRQETTQSPIIRLDIPPFAFWFTSWD